MAGVDLHSIMKFLVHADYEMTLRYAHLAPDYLKTVVRNGWLGMEILAAVQNPTSNWDLNRDQELANQAESVQSLD